MTSAPTILRPRPHLSRADGVVFGGIAVVLLANLTGLVFHGDGFNPIVERWLAVLSVWAAVVLVWLAVNRVRLTRPDIILAAAAVTALAVGDTAHRLLPDDGAGATPSLADSGYLLFYVFMVGVLAVIARRSLRTRAWPALVNSALGALGATSVFAVLLSPAIETALGSPFSVPVFVSVAFPVLDLLLIAALGGIAAIPGRVLGRSGLMLAVGLLLVATADTAYARQVQGDSVFIGSALDGARAIGFALITAWVFASARRRDLPERTAMATVADGTAFTASSVTAPMAATTAGLAVLLLASQAHVSLLAVGLAGGTLALAAIPLAFRQRHLHSLSRIDELTGLPNRRALAMDVSTRLSAVDARPSALLVLDLDRFKEVNDSLGHEAGDLLLEQIGARLSGALQSGDLLARLGGDEFAVHLHHADRKRATAMARRLRLVTARPLVIDGLSLEIGLSIGIAMAPEHGSDLSGLMRKADMAMYAAKSSRVGQHVYSPGDDSNDKARLRTLHELRIALAEKQLVLHYQPKVHLPTGTVPGVEALVRWNHPTRGLLYPAAFLDVAENGGLMRSLTREVLELALDQAVLWQAQGRTVTVAVNLSSRSLADYQLAGVVTTMLAERGLPGSALMLEVTEEFLLVDRDRARNILLRLRNAGVLIAVDDFGTGYSSLAYLRDLPIDELKLDQSFVIPMLDDARASALVASSIHLGHSLGMRIVAEGVETAEVLDQLARFDCDVAQGYHLSRPIPAAELERWLDARTALPVGLRAVR
ncbi:bifunctional diguanylate cyclase/phosphodiesterase [Cryobacterium sp. SO1]|uniref:putative bifunctional diguanylate cyclase/phosphodiesterase n=1 Tax=Cryobacterium sp. SO1 TaxID=1897061 RepID=UPI001022A90C|nr:EAL domain-containing protein [Cryobacterium sp. SO1]RZI34142.1 putative signaling protein [Cryobacterium sp. SO1]